MINHRQRKWVTSTELPFFGFDIDCVLERSKMRLPLTLDWQVKWWIVDQQTLASIERSPRPHILLHSILNHHQTPELVMDFILTHELLHLIIPPREINGIMKSHPPEYRNAELQVFPEAELAWSWLIVSLQPCWKPDAKREVTIVKKSWRRFVLPERPSIEQVGRFLGRSKYLPVI